MMPTPNAPDWVLAALQQRQEQNLLRRTVTLAGPQGPHGNIDGQDYRAFCSNDYLGLASHPKVIAALQQGAAEYGVGGGASHLVCGHLAPHQALEEALAQWLGYERVILFSTGYMANLGIISALASKDRAVIQDKLNHASLIDGALLAQAPLKRYLHADLDSARQRLQKSTSSGLLVTDGVFSMDGDVAPLAQLSRLALEYEHIFMVDDAHGLGCCGPEGRGSAALAGLDSKQLPILMGTFGKAFGTAGAFVATSDEFADYLMQFARPYIYTTSMSPAMAVATLASLTLIQSPQGEELREKLQANICYFRQRMAGLAVTLMVSDTAIQPLLIGQAQAALELSDKLKALGFWCTAIRPPTVPAGSARLRITLSAAHSHADVVLLCDAIEQVMA